MITGPARRPTAHSYGPDSSQFADLWLPTGSGPHPVVVVLHGGFWGAAYGRQLMNGVSADLADRGWAAWNLEYRRIGGGGGWPETFADVAAGIDALADLADLADPDHALDLDTLAVVGHSAGGHLALWAATRTGLPPGAPGASPAVAVTAAVALAGVTDLVVAAEDRIGWDAVRRLMGGGPEEFPDRYALGSPAARLPLGVPQLLMHGDADRDVPADLSRRYAEEAARQGDRVTLVVLPGVGHMEPVDPASPAWNTVVEWLSGVNRRTYTGECKEPDADP